MADVCDQTDERDELLHESNIKNAGSSYQERTVNDCMKCGETNDRKNLGYATCRSCFEEVSNNNG